MQNLDVCEKCPATVWGMTANCKAYEMHISKVKDCPEWGKNKRSQIKGNHKYRITTADMAAMLSYKYKGQIKLVSEYENSHVKVKLECQHCKNTFMVNTFSALSMARKKCPVCKNTLDSREEKAGDIRLALGIGVNYES